MVFATDGVSLTFPMDLFGDFVRFLCPADKPITSSPDLIHFTYILWIGQNRSERHSIQMAIPVNTTFFEAMKIAAETDPNFEWVPHFYAKNSTTISCYRDYPMEKNRFFHFDDDENLSNPNLSSKAPLNSASGCNHGKNYFLSRSFTWSHLGGPFLLQIFIVRSPLSEDLLN